jgi:predicted DsbA family dithiol-disulfide isomerase
VTLRVRAWPLEIVNGTPLEAAVIAEEVEELRREVAPELFAAFTEASFPSTSLPALALAASAYRRSDAIGEEVSLALRDLCFERGVDIAEPRVLADLAADFDLSPTERDADRVLEDHAEGVRRGVTGSPHFFTPSGGFFCPSLDVSRDADGRLRVVADQDAFDAFMADALSI